MERNNSMLDPTRFTENPFAFIVHAQNCYFLSQQKNMASLALFQSFDREFYIEEQNIRPIHLADVTVKSSITYVINFILSVTGAR